MKKHLLRSLLAFCVLFFGVKSVEAATNKLKLSNNTGGLAANPLDHDQSKIALFSFTAANTGATNYSITAFKITASANISMFPTVWIYSSTSPTYPGTGATLVTTINSPGTTMNVTGVSSPINAGNSLYYYVVVDYTDDVTDDSSPTIRFSLTSATTSSGNATTITGSNFNGTNYTMSSPVNLAANTNVPASTLSTDQTLVPLTGFSVKTTQSETFTAFNFATPNLPVGGAISNIQLFTGTTGNYNTAALTSILCTYDPNTDILTPTTPQTINGTVFYYIKATYTAPGANGTFKLNLTSASTAAFDYTNGATITGATITCNSAVKLAAAGGGLTIAPLTSATANVVLADFSVTTTQSEAITSFQFAASQNIGPAFTNLRLFLGNATTYAASTSKTLIGSVTGTALNTAALTIPVSTQNIPAATPKYYFIVADFVGSSTTVTFKFNTTTASTATIDFTNGGAVIGASLTLSHSTYNWKGGTAGFTNDWNTAGNWSPATVPGPYDKAQIGVSNSFAYNPTVSAITSVGSIDFGNDNTATILTTNNTLTVNGDITMQNSNVNSSVGLAGTGILNVVNVNIQANDESNSGFITYKSFTETINSSVDTLNVSGNISLISDVYFGGIAIYSDNAAFNITGGTVNITGTGTNTGILQTSNAPSIYVFLFGNYYATSSFSVANSTLNIFNPNFLSGLDNNSINSIAFDKGGANINYSGPAAQTVYTDANITGLDGGVDYTSIGFSGAGVKTPNNGTLNIAGNFTNTLINDAANYVNLTATPVIFGGSNAQTLAGGGGSGTAFSTVSFNGASTKTMSTGAFSVISTGTLTMAGTGSNCILDANGLLTLNSDISGTATVTAFSNSKIINNVNVQRFVSGGALYRGYRLFSSPVNISQKTDQTGTGNAAYVDPTYLNGGMSTGGPGTGFNNNGIANPLTYLYDDTRVASSAHFYSGKNVGINSITPYPTYNVTPMSITGTPLAVQQVPVGNSLMVYYAGTGALSNASPGDAVVTAIGTLNQGTINVWLYKPTGNSQALTKTGDGSSTMGLNQVGNPYPSTIKLSGTTGFYNDNKASISNIVYELDPSTGISGAYLAFDALHGTSQSTAKASDFILSGQGFWVTVKTGITITPVLKFNETEKAAYPAGTVSGTAITGTLLMDIPPTASNHDITAGSFAQNAAATTTPKQATDTLTGLHLQLSQGNAYYTQTGIYFSNKWADMYNETEDAIDLGSTLSSYSTDGKRLAINLLADYTKSKRIKLYAGATASGLYTFSLADILNIDTNTYNVFLIDNKMNDSLDMAKYKTYAFNINTADTTTYGANRFVLAIERKYLPQYKLISFSGKKVSNGIQLYWQTQNAGNNTGFVLQKFNTGNTYGPVYSIQSNSSALYAYTDEHPVTGNNTYRLQQTDVDGIITYSAPVTIYYNALIPNGKLTIYPNPSKSIINISLTTNNIDPAGYIANIYDLSGNVVAHKIVTGDHFTEDITSYKLGIYVIELKTNSGNLLGKAKFVKIN